MPPLFCQPLVPVKDAVMVWLPTASVTVLNDAWPLPFTTTAEARVVAPSVKVTVPVGVPAPLFAAVIVAVKVTDCQYEEGLGADATVVTVPSWTTCGTELPLLFCHPLVPVNDAVMVWLPAGRAEVLKDAWPLPFTATPDANVVAPSVKATVPTGSPPGGNGRRQGYGLTESGWVRAVVTVVVVPLTPGGVTVSVEYELDPL